MKLAINEEIMGKLTNVEVSENGQIKLSFLIQKEIEISANAFSIPKLQSLVGKNIGVLNIDSQFFLREIKKR